MLYLGQNKSIYSSPIELRQYLNLNRIKKIMQNFKSMQVNAMH